MADGRPAPIVVPATNGNGANAPPKPPNEERLSLLVYGSPGVGKTFLAGTAEDDPRSAPVLVVDMESGSLTISWRKRAMRIMSTEEVGGDLMAIAEACRKGKAIFKPTGEPFRTVVIDSITDHSVAVQEGLMRRSGRSRNAEANTMDYSEWNVYTNVLRELVRAFRDSGVHLIMTALEREDDGMYRPDLSGKKVSANLPANFNTVARLFIKPVPGPNGTTVPERRLLMQSDVKYICKDRSDPLGKQPRELVKPTVAMLLDRMEEGQRQALAAANGGAR